MVLVKVEQVLIFSGGVYSGIEHNMELKFSMQTFLTHINIIFEYCHAAVILENVDFMYLEDINLYRPVLNNKIATMFFLKETFLFFIWHPLKFVKRKYKCKAFGCRLYNAAIHGKL